MIRLGVIGTGRIAKRAVKEIKNIPGIEAVAVLNPNIEHAKAFAEENGISESFNDSTDFYNTVDAVYIATPHGTHFEYAKSAIQNKKHVLCEKPMVLDMSEAKELFELAEVNHVALMEGIKTLYCPGFKKICEVISSGTIGKVVDVEAAFTRLTAPGCREFEDIVFGGSFTEFGSYTLLPIIHFLGTDYINVSYFSVRHSEGEDTVDGYTKALINYGDKCGTGKTGLTVKSEGQLLISGTDGYILVPSPWWLTRYFEVRYEDSSRVEKYETEYEGDGLRYEFSEFTARVELAEKNFESHECKELNPERDEVIARAAIMGDFLCKRKK